MDTSETYIKMCEKARKIQGQCSYSLYDYFAVRGTSHIFRYNKNSTPRAEYIWLPRQAQLQDMLPEFIAKAGFVALVASHFADFTVACANNPSSWNLETFEQYWLAYVMWEKYDKKWSGKNWVKN